MQVVLIGLGEPGATLHLPALAGLPGASIVGAADVRYEARRRAAERGKIPVYSAAEDLLAQTSPDVVIVGTPPPTHAEYCLRALPPDVAQLRMGA